jgi:hypothetical protein
MAANSASEAETEAKRAGIDTGFANFSRSAWPRKTLFWHREASSSHDSVAGNREGGRGRCGWRAANRCCGSFRDGKS